MTHMSLKGTHKARVPFKCHTCGDTYQPPSRYMDVILSVNGKWRWRRLCLFCVAYG